MKTEHYSQFLGLSRSTNSPDAPQVSALKQDNYIVSRKRGSLIKRGGSKEFAVTGDILGIGAYSLSNSSYLVPNVDTIIRHRRNGATSFFEKYNSTAGTWSAITQGANTSFGDSGIAQFAQHGSLLAIFAGRPAMLKDISSGAINRLGGPAPSAAPTWNLSAGSLSGLTQGFITFYDTNTGWESSPSPVTSLTTLASQQISWASLPTTVAKEGVTHKRLYRTLLGANGEPPYYRVTEVTLATTTYADTSSDATLEANVPYPDEFDEHDPPPDTSYIGHEYQNIMWVASGRELYYSKPDDGSGIPLEYFSDNRKFILPQKITALIYTPDFGRLLVFCPVGHGIWQITGRSEGTFELELFKDTDGTDFPSSVSANKENVCYWGEEGPSLITPSGIVTSFGEDIREMIREYALAEYTNVFICSQWSPQWQAFLWSFSATDTSTSQWEDTVTGITVEWQDSVSGALVEWA